MVTQNTVLYLMNRSSVTCARGLRLPGKVSPEPWVLAPPVRQRGNLSSRWQAWFGRLVVPIYTDDATVAREESSAL